MPRLHLKNSTLLNLGLIVVVACAYFFRLGKLPVFADEAIYIRWAQLIIDDMPRYAFFPLNDGKTPLFMWLLVPFQFLPLNHLLAARVVSSISAILLVWTAGLIAKELGAQSRVVLLTRILMASLPFWFFSARLALIDITLVLFLAAMTWSLLRFYHSQNWLYVLLSGICFGMALWTKIPAVLGLSMLGIVIIPFLHRNHKRKQATLKQTLVAQLSIVLIGCTLFALLKLHPAFGQLFSRGSDFLLPSHQRSILQLVQNTMRNANDFIEIFARYLSLSGLVLTLTAVFLAKHRKTILILLLISLGYILPIMVLGKVVYARYLLPAALPLTLAIAFAIDNYLTTITTTANLGKKTLLSIFVALMMAHIASSSTAFILYSWLNPNRLPLTKSDREQYLSEWSSGNGIYETAQLIQSESTNKKLLVLTEGYFGTLPDGLLLYLHRTDVRNIFIEGIGQPIVSIPPKQKALMPTYDRVWLVVNSHRNKLSLNESQKIASFCRLAGDPCLQVWDITTFDQ